MSSLHIELTDHVVDCSGFDWFAEKLLWPITKLTSTKVYCEALGAYVLEILRGEAIATTRIPLDLLSRARFLRQDAEHMLALVRSTRGRKAFKNDVFTLLKILCKKSYVDRVREEILEREVRKVEKTMAMEWFYDDEAKARRALKNLEDQIVELL